jgi:hypothetical protein
LSPDPATKPLVADVLDIRGSELVVKSVQSCEFEVVMERVFLGVV